MTIKRIIVLFLIFSVATISNLGILEADGCPHPDTIGAVFSWSDLHTAMASRSIPTRLLPGTITMRREIVIIIVILRHTLITAGTDAVTQMPQLT
ncbi:MAG: hypothetical protein OXU36_07880 [Candidatus Poribacteria bacterium]|nr:hypothetical protein [Candidatus Poribacteria bacterium]